MTELWRRDYSWGNVVGESTSHGDDGDGGVCVERVGGVTALSISGDEQVKVKVKVKVTMNLKGVD